MKFHIFIRVFSYCNAAAPAGRTLWGALFTPGAALGWRLLGFSDKRSAKGDGSPLFITTTPLGCVLHIIYHHALFVYLDEVRFLYLVELNGLSVFTNYPYRRAVLLLAERAENIGLYSFVCVDYTV